MRKMLEEFGHAIRRNESQIACKAMELLIEGPNKFESNRQSNRYMG